MASHTCSLCLLQIITDLEAVVNPLQTFGEGEEEDAAEVDAEARQPSSRPGSASKSSDENKPPAVLEEEVNRRQEVIQGLKVVQPLISGNALVTSAFLNYAGPLNPEARQTLLSETLPNFASAAGLMSAVPTPVAVLRLAMGDDEALGGLLQSWLDRGLVLDGQRCVSGDGFGRRLVYHATPYATFMQCNACFGQ